MHSSPPNSAVVVLNLPAAVDAACAGCEISSLPGVFRVTADPERRQLLVRYAPDTITLSEIRACLMPEGHSALPSPLLAAWPRVADVLPIAAGLL